MRARGGRDGLYRRPGESREPIPHVSGCHLDLHHDLPGRHLLAFRDVDGGHRARHRRVCTCSIFIASSVITGWPAASFSPALTSTATTRPFIAARTLPSPPLVTIAAGGASVRSRTEVRDPRAGCGADRRRAETLRCSITPFSRKRKGVAGQIIDLEAAPVAVAAGEVATVALADDFDLFNAVPEMNPDGERKGRRQGSRPGRHGGAWGFVT